MVEVGWNWVESFLRHGGIFGKADALGCLKDPVACLKLGFHRLGIVLEAFVCAQQSVGGHRYGHKRNSVLKVWSLGLWGVWSQTCLLASPMLPTPFEQGAKKAW